MARLSTSFILISLALITFTLFSGVSFAFSPDIQAGSDSVDVLGITPTATSSPGNPPQGGGSGSRPPSIPEPTTVILTGLGLAGLAGYVARKKRHDSNDPPEN